jgi:hypothetical protein
MRRPRIPPRVPRYVRRRRRGHGAVPGAAVQPVLQVRQVVGLHKSGMKLIKLTRSLKAPGFNPC